MLEAYLLQTLFVLYLFKRLDGTYIVGTFVKAFVFVRVHIVGVFINNLVTPLFAKAYSPIDVTLSGITIEFKEVHS